MNELEKILLYIKNVYDYINENWTLDERYFPLNMKSKKVEDIYENEDLISYVFNYRNFVNDYVPSIMSDILSLKFISTVSLRVKAVNSIQYKIKKYKWEHENGKIAIKKCLNDIIGFRIIFNENIDYIKIKEFIERNHPNLKCIEAIRGEYFGIHIYFGNDDNKKFQWELQVWDKKHQVANLSSHAIYKQDYIKWENKSK